MKKRIALAAIAALAGGLLVAAPATAANGWTLAKVSGGLYQVGESACFYASDADATYSISPSEDLSDTLTQTPCVTSFQHAGAHTITASWTSPNKTSSVSFNVTSDEVVVDPVVTGDITTAGTAIAGVANTTPIIVTAPDNRAAYVTVTGASTVIEGYSSKDFVYADLANSFKLQAGKTVTVYATTHAVGTITASLFRETALGSGQFETTASVTGTVVVSLAPAPIAWNHATVSALVATDDADSKVADGVLYTPKAEGKDLGESAGHFTVKQYTSVTDTDTALADGLAKDGTVTLSGVGSLSKDPSGLRSTYLTFSGSDSQAIYVHGDGRSGTAEISVVIGGGAPVVRKVVFYGSIAHFDVSVDHKQVDVDSAIILTVKATDAAGVAVPVTGMPTSDSASVTYNPGNTWGVETYTVDSPLNGKKVAAIVTMANGVDTKTAVANFVTAGIETITVTADKAEYAPGEKATITVTAVNVDGVVAGDRTYGAGTSADAVIAATAAVIGLTDGKGGLKFTDGKATFTGYMPLAQGPVTVNVEVGKGKGSVSVKVVDAAAVANAAAVTALQTSVATLTTTVASLVASMTAQIKVINATMLKIQKAIAALRLQIKKLK